MTGRSVVAGVILMVSMVWVPASAAAQAASDAWTVPRTPDGYPDLQGVWANNNATPLERPAAWAGKSHLTDEELAEFRAAAADVTASGLDAVFGDQLALAALAGITDVDSYDPGTGNYNQFWLVERDFDTRTSLVVDPPDGRIPPRTPDAERAGRGQPPPPIADKADSWADRPLSERCVTYGVPSLFAGYNSYYQIFQSRDHAVVLMEMIHDARVIPIDGPPHPEPNYPAVARRLARPLGRRHSGGRDQELLQSRRLLGRVRGHHRRRTAHARRAGYAELRGHVR